MSNEWFAWGIVVLVLISAFFVEMYNRGKQKKFIYAYKEKISSNKKAKYFSELRSIGEFKEERFNNERRCYEFRFRQNFKYLSIFSNISMSQLLNIHLIKKDYFIVFNLNAYLFEKEVKIPYEKELGWTLQAYIYRFISFCFNLTPSGIILSLIIMGSVFLASLTIPFGFLIGCGVGLVISALNYSLQKSNKVVKNLLKRKKEMITTELYLSPLESEEEIYDIYQVQGTKEIMVRTDDGAEETRIIKLLDDEKANYLTVQGFDELYNLQTDKLGNVKNVKWIGQDRRKRTNQEMLNLKRSYLTRNKALTEDIYRLQAENERIQIEYRSLQVQLQHEVETKDKEMRTLYNRWIKKQEEMRNTLYNIYEDLKGAQFVSENFEQTHERVMRRINKENFNKEVNKLGNLIDLVKNLIIDLGRKADITPEDIQKLFKLNEFEVLNEDVKVKI